VSHERSHEAAAEAAEPAVALPAAPGGAAGLLLGLQRSAGNAAVARLVAGRRMILRSPEQDVIDRNTDWLGANLNEEKLGAELAGLLPGDPNLVNKVLWKLPSSDRDDVVLALVEAVPLDSELRKKAVGNDWLFRGMVNWLIDGPTEVDEAKAIDRLTRAWSGTHRRLKTEGWSSDPAVVAALKAQGATFQSSSDWWASGDFIHDEYAIVMDTMPSGTTPEAYLAEMAADLNKAVNSADFDSINTFHRRPLGTGGPAVGDVYHIDIKGPDNGSVMLVESTSDHFIFQTVTTKEDGTHPEYGARQFGFEKLQGGAVRWYTRGTSRPAMTPGGGTIGRHAQEAGWTRMLRGMAAELVKRGGTERSGSFSTWNTHRNDATS